MRDRKSASGKERDRERDRQIRKEREREYERLKRQDVHVCGSATKEKGKNFVIKNIHLASANASFFPWLARHVCSSGCRHFPFGCTHAHVDSRERFRSLTAKTGGEGPGRGGAGGMLVFGGL